MGLNDKNKGRESRDPIPIKGQFHEIFLTLPGPKGSKSPDTVPLTCLCVIYTVLSLCHGYLRWFIEWLYNIVMPDIGSGNHNNWILEMVFTIADDISLKFQNKSLKIYWQLTENHQLFTSLILVLANFKKLWPEIVHLLLFNSWESVTRIVCELNLWRTVGTLYTGPLTG